MKRVSMSKLGRHLGILVRLTMTRREHKWLGSRVMTFDYGGISYDGSGNHPNQFAVVFGQQTPSRFG